jgi:hypothetical protein
LAEDSNKRIDLLSVLFSEISSTVDVASFVMMWSDPGCGLDWYPNLTLKFVAISVNDSFRSYTVYNSLCHPLIVPCLLCLFQSSSNGFHCRTFPFLFVTELSPCLSHINSRLTLINNSSKSSQSHITIESQSASPSWCQAPISSKSLIDYSLHRLCTDSTENTASNSF